MRTINEIIIHCTATRPDQDFHAADIDRWHKANGWGGIGYHFIIDLDGTIENGRPVERCGVHCAGHNANTIGIVYVGGVVGKGKNKKPADTRTKAQILSMHHLVTELMWRFPLIGKISGHNEYSNKACPCFDVPKEFDYLCPVLGDDDWRDELMW